MIEGGPPRLGVVPMLGDDVSEGEEAEAAPRRASGRKLVDKSSRVDAVSKMLLSEDVQRLPNLESTVRASTDADEEVVGRILIGEVRALKSYNVDVAELEMLKAGVGLHEEDKLSEEHWAQDDVTGEHLDAKAVRAARREEMSFIKGIPLYEEADVAECWRRTGKAPVSTKCVDVAKGSDVRLRWVARDFKPKGEKDRADVFAAMPPLEANRMLFRKFATQANLKGEHKMKLMLIDVKKAHLNEQCDRDDVFVELPAEAGAPGKCGRLLRWLYGMREAASAWELDYSLKLKGEGFVEGASARTVFYNAETKTRCVVHGDDFTFLGYKSELQKVKAKMAEWYELKVRGILGTDEGDMRVISILNREIEVTEQGLLYRADSKHARLIWEKLGFTRESTGVSTPFVRDNVEQEDAPLSAADATMFRQVAARANYLSQDRPDIQFAVKEVCAHMAEPTEGGVRKLKHLARYLIAHPEVSCATLGCTKKCWRPSRYSRTRTGRAVAAAASPSAGGSSPSEGGSSRHGRRPRAPWRLVAARPSTTPW